MLAHYREHGRALPWRETHDAYEVLVSEVMLQQTQVSRVEPKYAEFLAAFPDIEALAAAPLAAVLEAWSGLGYNRRAVSLKRLAEVVVAEHGGAVPRDPVVLATLPGIGKATASAIVTYAFEALAPFIETNVRAAFLHHFFADADDVPDRDVLPIVEATWDRECPREWGYALMDYGTHLKRTLPNPSRRSRHHTRQSRFEGSDRQARGAFLRALVREGALTVDGLAEGAGIDPARAERLLGDLEREGFFVRESDGLWAVGA
ncbi:MAG: A/G-specific adenine glycosylase [Coriobacteriia bacterium]|nr:A/G-specific adenine glycosylase [Coriobacteriia bacterium]